MSNKTFLALLVLVIMSAFCNTAFALNFSNFYPVTGFGKTLELQNHEYNYGDTPFIYASISNPNPGTDFLSSVYTDWYFGDIKKYEGDDVNNATQINFWFSPDKWSTMRQPGTWLVNGNFSIDGVSYVVGSGSTTFTVRAVPEPVSTILFLTGGAVFLGKRLLREKK